MAKEPKAQKVTVALEIGNNYIKLSQTSFFKHHCISLLINRTLSSKEDNVISQEIANLFNTLNIPQKIVLLNIPRHFVMARFLHLPSTNDDEINNMIEIESSRHMPYTTEEIIISHRIINKSKDGFSDILLAMVQANAVNRLVNILKNANLTIEKIALGSESLFGWYSLGGKKKEEDQLNIALINVDAEYIDIAIIEKGDLAFTRGFTYISENLDDNEKIVDEIKTTIATYQKEKSLDIDRVFVTGAENKIKGLESILKKEPDISLEILAQDKDIQLDKKEDANLSELSFVELIGLSLKAEDIRINLLPKKMIEAEDLRLIKKNLARISILLICIIVVVSGLVTKRLFDKSRYLSFLNSEIKTIEPKVTKVKRMKEEIKIIKQEIQKKPLAIDILAEIYRITSENITFILLDYESNRSLILKGSASSLNEVIKFISILENSQYFKDVKIKYTTKRLVSGRQMTDFEIVCLLPNIG